MSYNCFQRCSICPKNVGHYCDGCEVTMDRVLYEANKLNMDCEHLKTINAELQKQIYDHPELYGSFYPSEEKVNVGFLRMSIRKERESIVKKREFIEELEKELIEYDNLNTDIVKVCDEIKKLRALSELYISKPDIDVGMNINSD